MKYKRFKVEVISGPRSKSYGHVLEYSLWPEYIHYDSWSGYTGRYLQILIVVSLKIGQLHGCACHS